MSAADDVAGKLEKVIDAIKDLDGAFGKAIDETDDAIDKAEAVGHDVPVQAFGTVRDALSELRKPLDDMEGEIEKLRDTVNEFGKGG